MAPLRFMISTFWNFEAKYAFADTGYLVATIGLLELDFFLKEAYLFSKSIFLFPDQIPH